MLAAIWAQDETGLIGKDDHLPWHLPNDLKFFKRMTENNVVVMGRKTFEGMGGRPLPNRKTVVLTTAADFQAAEGVLVCHSVEEVLAFAETFEGTTFIAGGARVYEEFFPYYDILYRTVIHQTFEGDTYFPNFDLEDWVTIDIVTGEEDEKNPYVYQFETYERRMKEKIIVSQ